MTTAATHAATLGSAVTPARTESSADLRLDLGRLALGSGGGGYAFAHLTSTGADMFVCVSVCLCVCVW